MSFLQVLRSRNWVLGRRLASELQLMTDPGLSEQEYGHLMEVIERRLEGRFPDVVIR